MMKEKQEYNWNIFLVCVILFVPLLLTHAWIFKTMWIWFLVPLGAPIISLWAAVGLKLVYSVVSKTTDSNDEKSEVMLRKMFTNLIVKFSFLGMGAIVYYWIM